MLTAAAAAARRQLVPSTIFKQRLLHTFTAHIPRDGRCCRTFTGNFIDFVNINNTLLRHLHIEPSAA